MKSGRTGTSQPSESLIDRIKQESFRSGDIVTETFHWMLNLYKPSSRTLYQEMTNSKIPLRMSEDKDFKMITFCDKINSFQQGKPPLVAKIMDVIS